MALNFLNNNSGNNDRSTVRSTNVRCEAVVYHYKQQKKDETPCNADTVNYRISEDIMSFTFQKGIKEPQGSFTLTLGPRTNYRKVIGPGDWIIVKLYNDSKYKEHKRLLGIVNRVAREEIITKNGEHRIVYQVSGSDFGKVFAYSNIWYNPDLGEHLAIEPILLKSIGVGSNPNIPNFLAQDVMRALLSLWLSPNSAVSRFRQVQPFLVPTDLTKELGKSVSDFYGLLNKDDKIFNFSQGSRPIHYYGLHGSLWSNLKQYSNHFLNELFVEMDGDPNGEVPTFFLRPHPFSTNDLVGGADNIKFTKLASDNSTSFTITGADILMSNIGVNDHNNINGFMITSNQTLLDATTAVGIITSGEFPAFYPGSIARHGLRLFSPVTDYDHVDEQVLIDWNHFLLDLHKDLNLLEEGTIQIIGNPNTRVGKVLKINNANVNTGKAFYIIGYQDEWKYGGQWVQTLKLTRGQYFDGSNTTLVVDKEDNNDAQIGQTLINNIRPV